MLMKTEVLKPDKEALVKASNILKQGGLVAFPTETVYGLGANALDKDAVLEIFKAKNRPADNPLIVHIWSRDQLPSICEIPPGATSLMDAFWPGPLTLLFPKKGSIPSVVTAGLDTVAVRMPSHPVAQQLLKECSLPVAAPSANTSGRPSPTEASHVLEDMNGRIPLILDGGNCDVGVESTVLDICHGLPCILRPGGITREMLESALNGPVSLAASILRPLQPGEKALSPGMRYRHYAPRGTVTLVEGSEQNVVAALKKLYLADTSAGKKSCVMCFTEHLDILRDCRPRDLGSCHDPAQTAHRLFNTLRSLDDDGMETVYSESVSLEGIGLAVMNRLGRAASFRILEANRLIST